MVSTYCLNNKWGKQFFLFMYKIKDNTTPWILVRKRTIPPEGPLVDEVSTN
jgi:hypothetical protein